MGERNRDRQLRDARGRYLGAWQRAKTAGRADVLGAIPIDPDSDWTDQHRQALLDITTALQDLLNAHQEWVGLCRDRHAPHQH